MADELRAKIRASVQRAMETARQRQREAAQVRSSELQQQTEARRRLGRPEKDELTPEERLIDDANRQMVERARALEHGAFENALRYAHPAEAQQMRSFRGVAEMPTVPTPNPEPEPAPRSETDQWRGSDELGNISPPVDQELLERLESLAWDVEERAVDREIAESGRPAPREKVGEAIPLHADATAKPDPATERAMTRQLRADPAPSAGSFMRPVLPLLSDERAKKDVTASTDPRPYTGPLAPTVGGPIEGVSTARSGLAAGPMAPSAYMRQAAQMGHGREPSVTLGERFRPEVAEARTTGPDPMRKGLAENDAADRRRRALDFMQFSASMPQFEMVDVGGAYRG